jgi:integrase
MKIVFRWARAHGFRTGDNPAEDAMVVLPKLDRKQKHLAALPYADLPVFIEKLRTNEKAGVFARLAFEFLILCAARTSEVLKARWSEIDLEKKCWTVPAERMKAHSQHCVPLSARCIEILKETQQLAKDLGTNSEFVFPGRGLKQHLGDNIFDNTLRLLEYDITTHGFRSTFRDWCEEKTKFPHRAIESALAHQVPGKVEGAYLRTTLYDKRVQLMQAWADFATKPAGQVVRFRA